MFFVTILNGIVLLISFSVSLLFAYKNATGFWILIFYPPTLLNSFISSSSLLLETLGFSVYSIMSSAHEDSFTSSFAFWMSCISSTCLIARTSRTMLTKRGESWCSCLVLILRGMLVVFVYWVWCWQWVCHTWPLLCLGMFPLIPLCWGFFFYHKWVLDIIKCFFASIDMIMWFLYFILFIW